MNHPLQHPVEKRLKKVRQSQEGNPNRERKIRSLLTAAVQLHSILRQRRVSADTVVGGINTYLLFALAFMLIHSLVELLEPGAYRLGGAMLSEYVLSGDLSESFATMLYFSFVTITTLGYGDIAPQTVLGKVLASAVMILGYGIIAVPTGIVTVEIAGALKHSTRTEACGECGAEDHASDAVFCKYCGAKL